MSSVADPSAGSGGELAALELLAAYGIPTPEVALVASEEEAVDAAFDIGYPVVLKTSRPIDHKTEAGGVLIGISDEAGLRKAYQEMSKRLGPEALVAETVAGGVEVGLGMITDPQFGPVVILSGGGNTYRGDRRSCCAAAAGRPSKGPSRTRPAFDTSAVRRG